MKLPILFITHGSPLLGIVPERTSPLLAQLGKQLTTLPIQAVLVISSHWITPHQPYITAAKNMRTLHDFYGFPKALYQLTYPVSGAPHIAQNICASLQKANINCQLDEHRGLDHGAWIPLRLLFPDGQFPCLQLSLPNPISTSYARLIGQALAPLRAQGILIIGSGSMTHNLYDMGYDEQPADYIAPFTEWVHHCIMNHDLSALENFVTLAPHAKQAHPTIEHFVPLITAFSATDHQDIATHLEGGISYQSLAMDHYLFEQAPSHTTL